MFKALLTVFFILLIAYVVATISGSLKRGRQARMRFYMLLFIAVVLAFIILHFF